MYSSASDLAKLMNMLLTPYGKQNNLLPVSILTEMLQPG